ncbi:MAG: phosphotransferase [Gammaproteobacteria bacterium]|nr:phosphotransferase [Gammaproteobacteria bacterium]
MTDAPGAHLGERGESDRTRRKEAPRNDGAVPSGLGRLGGRAAEASWAVLKDLGSLTAQTYAVSRGFVPLVKLLAHENDITREELGAAIDAAFKGLYAHPVTRSTERVTEYLRKRRLIPNEQSTEELIRFVVDQMIQRSPVPVPGALVDEFWKFFNELFSSPELKGLGELTLDMTRLVVRTYEPLLVEVVNLLKAGRRFNQWQLQELLKRAQMVREDALIVRRQIKAIRYIKPFFQADPRDFKGQAKIVAQMVREFGPFFVKMAQVAASNADFLPEEIAKELAVFHEDVPPMNEREVNQAFLECYGKLPTELYMGFDAARPVKSGSIGSIYIAKKPFLENGAEVLRLVVIKVGRHNIDREFTIGKLVLGLAIMSSQYWAPHSKLAPFLRAMQEQVDEFIAGFTQELDFEEEARSHVRFYERSRQSYAWRVPGLYGYTRRILEMEYLSDATSLVQAIRRMPKSRRPAFRRQVTDRLLYTMLSHIFRYGEIHGDLHPGNIMVGSDGGLYLIDWGNTVALEGKWGVVWDYLAGACIADLELLTDTLIRVSTQPEENARRRAEIKAALEETLAKKGVVPLTRRNFIGELRRGGIEGLQRRGRTVLHLMANTQHAGVVLKRDYLHLSRALFAAAGSFGTLYESCPKRLLALDVAGGLVRLPLHVSRDLLHNGVQRWGARLLRWLPLPDAIKRRLAPPPQLPALAQPPA